MNNANKKSEAELNQLCQAFLFNLQFIKDYAIRGNTAGYDRASDSSLNSATRSHRISVIHVFTYST